MATVHEPVPHGRRSVRPPLTAAGGEPVSVVHLTAEYFPYARTGGLAEAVSGLAAFQRAAGLDVAAILPLYRTRPRRASPTSSRSARRSWCRSAAAPRRRGSSGRRRPARGPQVYFLEHLEYFNRPGIYGENARRLSRQRPPLRLLRAGRAHRAAPDRAGPGAAARARLAHGARAGLSPHRARRRARSRPTVTHRALGAQPGLPGPLPARGRCPTIGLPWELFNWQQLEWYGKANFLKGGLVFADFVDHGEPDPGRASSRTPGGGFGLHDVFIELGDRLVGVLNGIDQRDWDPATDTQITAQYSAEKLDGKRRCKAALQRSFGLPQRRKVPLFGMTGRLVTQKGLDLILGADELLALDAQFVFLGSGEQRYEQALVELAQSAPNRIGVQLDFTDRLEHRLMAGADIFLMPSLYEPCGLTQMRAQRYGAPPIVRRVGGLADTVEDGVTGFSSSLHAGGVPEAALPRARCLRRHHAVAGDDAARHGARLQLGAVGRHLPRRLPPRARVAARR